MRKEEAAPHSHRTKSAGNEAATRHLLVASELWGGTGKEAAWTRALKLVGRGKSQLSLQPGSRSCSAKGLDTSGGANCPAAPCASRQSQVSSLGVPCRSRRLRKAGLADGGLHRKHVSHSCSQAHPSVPEEMKLLLPHLITRYLVKMENAEAASPPMHYTSHCHSPLCSTLIQRQFTFASRRCKLGYCSFALVPGSNDTERNATLLQGVAILQYGHYFSRECQTFLNLKPQQFPLRSNGC